MAQGNQTAGSKDETKPGIETEIGSQPGIIADEDETLQRHLSSRYIGMIAIGGSIGTGLIIGS